MTVKRNGDKVILKDGRASCSCCNCCMYYAQALANGLYTADDLPDEIELRQSTFPTEIFTKSGNGYVGNLAGAPWTIELREDLEIPGFFFWASFDADGKGANTASCLVGAYPKDDASSLTFGWDGWHTADRFADTYVVSGPINGTVSRIAKEVPELFGFSPGCEWVGDGLVLRYNGGFIAGPPFTPTGSFKWSVNGNVKSGFQNTPVGSYAGGFTVS